FAERRTDRGDRTVDVAGDAELVNDSGRYLPGGDVPVGRLLGDLRDQPGRTNEVPDPDAGADGLGEAGRVDDRTERIEGEHRGQRLASEPDVPVGIVLEDREVVLRREGQQRAPLGQRKGDPGRVLVVRDDVGQLRAYPGLQQRPQLVDVDTVL